MSFTKAELVTGDLVKVSTSTGTGYIRVYLDTNNGDIMSGVITWFPLASYTDEELFGERKSSSINHLKLLAVYRPTSNLSFGLSEPDGDKHVEIWKRDDTVKARAELRDLEQKLKELRSRARELNEIINDGKL